MRYTPSEMSKALVTLALGITTVLGTALADGRLDGLELLGVLVALANGFVVFKVSNMPEGVLYWKKAVFSSVGSCLAVLVTSLAGNVEPGVGIYAVFQAVTPAQWWALVFGVLTGVMTAIVPNAAASDGLVVHSVDDEYDNSEPEELTPEEEDLLPLPHIETEQGK